MSPVYQKRADIVPSHLAGTYHITSLDEVQVVAARVARELVPGDILLLHGGLGAGKTAFVAALARALHVGDRVTSPTFTVAAQYDVPPGQAVSQIVHVDLYRVARSGQIRGEDAAHMRDVFAGAKQLSQAIIVEWADKLGYAPPNAWKLHFELGNNEHERVLTIIKPR
ncbi:MAG: tRNA (adenosine(37)-N6)-threonylcarbamoyltransferase complex ATPase subunit type 1 TsaE [Acidobacteriota bacterium]